jgi:hypothetical protein
MRAQKIIWDADPDYTTPYDANHFDELPHQIQNDLLSWFNQTIADKHEKRMLYNLYMDYNFRAWDCPFCGTRVFKANPDSWDRFQGTLNQDFASYPGNNDVFTQRLINASCDYCRCYYMLAPDYIYEVLGGAKRD